METLATNSVVLWSLGLMLGVPLVLIALSEVIERLRRRGSGYETAFTTLRNIVVPVVALSLITTFVLQLDEGSVWQRLSLTLLLFVLSMGVLAFVASIRTYDKDKERWEARVPQIAKTVTRVLAFLLPFVLMLTAVWELDLSRFVTAIGVGSLAIGLALQNTLSSVVSGFLLALDKPFREGDWIEIDGVVGEVIDLNWRTTRLMVDGRDVVVIPNTTLLDSSLRNYTTVDVGYRDKISFGFAYKDLPNHVKDTALQVARECPHVSDHPPAEVFTAEYGDSSVNYEMHFHCERYISPFQAARTREDLMTRLFYAAMREGLEIPFPIRTLRQTAEGDLTEDDVKTMTTDAAKGHPVLGVASESALERLADRSALRYFGRDMVVSEIGEHDRGIGIIRSGAVRVETQDGQSVDYLPEGHLVGAQYILGQRANTLRLVAAVDTEILFIQGASVDAAMDESARLARTLGQYADARIAAYTRGRERAEGQSGEDR